MDLAGEKITIEKPHESWYRTYLGGMGSIAYHLLREMKGGEDPLGPENVLIMAPGVISGAREIAWLYVRVSGTINGLKISN